MEERSGEDKRDLRCAECGEALAHDQRYCLQCGTRRTPLPRYVAGLLASIRERGRRVASPARPEQDSLVEDQGSTDPWLVTPRAAAAAVLGMLGFGVIVGALVGGAGAALLRHVLLVVEPSHKAPAAVASTGSGPGGSGASAGSAPSARTVTVLSGGGSSAQTPGGGGANARSGTAPRAPSGPAGPLPPVKHVFLIVLSGQGYQETFGHSTEDPYLAGTLASKGLLIPYYYGVAASPLANEVALISGQGPTPQTIEDCPRFTQIVPGAKRAMGQIIGHGCVYPKAARTLGDELTKAHMTWKAYLQQKPGKNPKLETCHPKTGHPVPSQGLYAAWRNPFLYFRSIVGKTTCPSSDVSLVELRKDLKKTGTTPNLSYIVADLCHDGSSAECKPHAPSGMKAADTFLKLVVPQILASPAYKADGLLAITFDNAQQSGPLADSSSCCDVPAYPNLPAPPSSTTTTTTTPTATTTTTPTAATGTTTTTTTSGTSTGTAGTTNTETTTTTPLPPPPPCSTEFGGTCPTGGGGQVGLLLLSPYVVPGTQDPIDYFDHFSLLASIEDLFGVPRLGYASAPTLAAFQPSVFANYGG
jgi:phosphatidylinositol-3-phosphatase